MTTVTLKMKEIGVFGAKKRRKTLSVHDLVKKFFKEEVWRYILSGQDNFLMEDGFYVDKRGHIL